jgi:hypothetical protein
MIAGCDPGLSAGRSMGRQEVSEMNQRPQCVEEVCDEGGLTDEAYALINLLRLAYGDDELPPLECRLYGSVAEQRHNWNSDIDIITAEFPGGFTAKALTARGYVFVRTTGGDGILPVRLRWHHPVWDLALDLLWFGGTLWPAPLRPGRHCK